MWNRWNFGETANRGLKQTKQIPDSLKALLWVRGHITGFSLDMALDKIHSALQMSAILVLANRHRHWLLMRWLCFPLLSVSGVFSYGINACHSPTGRVQAMEKTKWPGRHTNSPFGGRRGAFSALEISRNILCQSKCYVFVCHIYSDRT